MKKSTMLSSRQSLLGWRGLIILLAVTTRSAALLKSLGQISDRNTPVREHTAHYHSVEAAADSDKVDFAQGIGSRCSKGKLEKMEAWLDASGVDRRGGRGGPPAVQLRYFGRRGLGLEAAIELERDSTVRNVGSFYVK